MDILKPSAVVGTNSWESAVYGKVLRGESVDTDTIRKCYERAKEKDLKDFRRNYVDIYWLHLPSDIEKNLNEITTLVKEGKIKHVGISNFTLDECKRAKVILDYADIPLYGVQNHYSLINRVWEKNGLKIPQVAVAFCTAKGIVPICGCRKPYQVDDLFAAANTKLTDEEVKLLENEAYNCSGCVGKPMYIKICSKEKHEKHIDIRKIMIYADRQKKSQGAVCLLYKEL